MAGTGLAHLKTPRAALMVLAACLLVAPPLVAADLGEFRVKREAIFEFAQKSVVTRDGDKVTILSLPKTPSAVI